MFNLAKDLGLYTDARYVALKGIIDGLVRKDAMILVPARVTLTQNDGLKIELDVADAVNYGAALTNKRITGIFSGLEFLRDYDITADRAFAGVKILYKVNEADTLKRLEAMTPANRMREILLDKARGQLWNEFKTRRGGNERDSIIFTLFTLYGIELPSSTTSKSLEEAVDKLPISDFGIKDVAVAEAFVNMVRLATSYSPTKYKQTNIRDFLARHGTPLPERTPRLKSLHRFFASPPPSSDVIPF